MKLGVICTAYNCADLFDKVFTPWFNVRKKLIQENSEDRIYISITHCCFKENHENGEPILSKDGSHKLFEEALVNNQIDEYVWFNHPASSEQVARNGALFPLLGEIDEEDPYKTDYIISIGADEVFSEQEILNIFTFLKQDNFVNWYSIEYKNLVFTETQYVKGFAPPRIFATNLNGFKLKEFYYDDDVTFNKNGKDYSYKELPQIKIPISIVNPLHYTWLNNERGKQKVKYQEKHFAHGAGCEYRWNEEMNCLEFNKEYYQKTGGSPPIIYKL